MLLSPRDGLYASIAAGTWPDISPFTTVPVVEQLLSHRLRDYQFNMLADVAALFRAGYRRVLLQAPTGAGKTVLAESVMASAQMQGLLSWFLVHRKELIKQTSATFSDAGLLHGFVAAKRPFDPTAQIVLAGVQTLVKRLDILLPPNLIIVDEAHHAVSETWAQILAAYPDAFILALTATPERLDGRGLDEHFDVMVKGPPPAWLIAQGFLSRFDYYAPHTPDMTGCPSQAGDFARSAAAEIVDKPTLIGNLVDHYMSLAPGEQGIVFAVNREHSRNLANEFIDRGIPAMHVDGSMDDGQRDYFDEAFRAGDIRIGCNVGLFGEGYDVPNISYLGIHAPTRSLVNHLQWCGRVLRPAPGKKRAVICDHAGNAVSRHLGLPDEDRDWTLEGRAARAARTGVNDDAFPVHQCKTCFRVTPSTVRTCPCGEEFPVQQRKIEQKAGTLTKLEREAIKQARAEERERERLEREARKAAEREEKQRAARQRKREEKACKGFDDFVNLANDRGIDNAEGWARMKLKFRNNYGGPR